VRLKPASMIFLDTSSCRMHLSACSNNSCVSTAMGSVLSLPACVFGKINCLDRVVPERMSQVWRRSEVGNHERRSLDTRLSSGTSTNTSANTSCRSQNEPGRMIRLDLFWYRNDRKMKPTYREKNLLNYLFGGLREGMVANQKVVLIL